MVMGMSVMREASFGGDLDAVFQEVEGRLGQTGGSRAHLPWAFWDVLLLADEGILGTNGTMFIVKFRLWLSLNKTSSPIALTSEHPTPHKGCPWCLSQRPYLNRTVKTQTVGSGPLPGR